VPPAFAGGTFLIIFMAHLEVVPNTPIAIPEPQKVGGTAPLVWMIPQGLALLAAGYFDGNFLRERTRKK
jgi:hypothetical protein